MEKFHFIGIKGTGMSALAQILNDKGHAVRGSDKPGEYYFTQIKLEERNIEMLPFNADNIRDDYSVVLGNAFPSNHEEFLRAKELGVPTYTYAEVLGKLFDKYKSIAVTGTHGKTTTSTMITTIFKENLPTSYLIGDGTGNGREDAEYFVAEACEYYDHFLSYRPDYAVVTNIEWDHPDYFKNIEDVMESFEKFVKQVQKAIVYCADDGLARKLKNNSVNMVSYGLAEDSDYRIANIVTNSEFSTFDIYKYGKFYANYKMQVFGVHDIKNATAAIAIADLNDLSVEQIQNAILKYHSPKRRFAEKKIGELVVVDDYAHHSTEIRATLDTARRKYPAKEIVAIFQPHTYTRTQQFLTDFAESLKIADKVFLLPIFGSAREEEEDFDVRVDDLLRLIPGAELIEDHNDLSKLDMEDAVLLFMGAGSINKLSQVFIEKRLKTVVNN